MDPYEAWATANDHESWTDILIAWNRVHAYRWVEGCMVYPLSLEVSRARRAITDAGFRFLAAYYQANHG